MIGSTSGHVVAYAASSPPEIKPGPAAVSLPALALSDRSVWGYLVVTPAAAEPAGSEAEPSSVSWPPWTSNSPSAATLLSST